MALFKLSGVLWLLAAALCLLQDAKASFLNDGRCAGKILRAADDIRSAANFTKNLNVATPDDKTKLIGMVNDMVYEINSGIHTIHQLIPSVASKPIHEDLSKILNTANEIFSEVLHYLHEDSDKLKECLPNSFNKIAVLAANGSEVLQKIEEKEEKFIINQVREGISQGSFTFLKVKLEIEFFALATKDLAPQVNARSEGFYASLQNITGNNHNHEELIYFIQHLEQVQARIVAKLKDFVYTDGEHEKNRVTVNEVLKELGELCEQFQRLVSSRHETEYLKSEFKILYKKFTNSIKKLFSVDVSGNIHGEVLIRSIFFDSVSLSSLYEREINIQPKRV